MTQVIDIFLLTLLGFTMFVIIRLRNLFAAVMLCGIYSFLGASWMLILDAPDVAFTEAAVGAGFSSLLMLGTLALTTNEEKSPPGKRLLPKIVVLIVGAFLIYGTLDMPAFGDPEAPVHRHVTPRYINDSPEEIGLPNTVTSVLASYRGYDTLGETTVIFTAGVGVVLLLRRRRTSQQGKGSP